MTPRDTVGVMTHIRKMIVVAAAAAAWIACNGLTSPPVGPHTEYPCGVWGVVCHQDKNGDSAMCCPQDHICGFDGPFSRCGAGLCCYDGDHWPSAAHDGGAPPAAVPQRKTGF